MISNFIFFKKKMLNKQIEKLFFYLMWIGIIVSINTNSSLLYLKSYKFFEIINFLRALAPLVIFSILVLYLLINIKNFNFLKNWSIYLNIICICILFYSTISILGLFLNNDQFFFDRIWWNISYLNVIFYLYLSSYFFGDKFLKNVFLILLLFIFCFYTSIAFMTIKETIILKIQNVYHSRLLSPQTFILDQGLPRTSGVARALFFLFLLHLSLLCFKKNYFYINLFLCFLYSWIISVFDSRITTVFFYISLLVILYSKLNLLKKIVIFLILITTFINSQHIYYYISILQTEKIEEGIRLIKRSDKLFSNLYKNYFNKENEEFFDDKNNIKKKEDKLKVDQMQNDTIYDINDINVINTSIIFFQKPFICNKEHFININSSARLCIWTDNLNTAFKNYSVFFFGHGAQADRYNVKYSSKTQEQSASNTFLYVLTSGGAISLIFIFVIYMIFIINFLKVFIYPKNKLLNESSIFISCLLMNSFILFRGITESSFAVFSLDYMLFSITTFIIFSKKDFNNNKKKYFNDIKK